MRYKTTGIDGVLNVHKEKGFTSHDVVAVVRKLTGCKTGHTGTLDPDAEGVLPICFGKATKISDYIASETKEYTARIAFGTETDTQDASGAVTAEKQLEIGEDALRTVIMSFVGDYAQLPPMYSALKVDGKKLYELAREGKEVERKARLVQIFDIQILEMDYPRSAMLHVVCSKGTYIRTLCTDIGQRANAAAHMAALLRTRTGAFRLENSIKLGELKLLVADGRLQEVLQPMRRALSAYREAVADSGEVASLLYNGNALPFAVLSLPEGWADGEKLLVMDAEDRLVGIYVVSEKEQLLRPQVILL